MAVSSYAVCGQSTVVFACALGLDVTREERTRKARHGCRLVWLSAREGGGEGAGEKKGKEVDDKEDAGVWRVFDIIQHTAYGALLGWRRGGFGFLLLRANATTCRELGEAANMFEERNKETICWRSLTWSRIEGGGLSSSTLVVVRMMVVTGQDRAGGVNLLSFEFVRLPALF